MTAERLAERIFTLADQQWFALASGDSNPIHVDALAARRLLAGDLVVHGMHLLLWSIDTHLASRPDCPSALSVQFHAPVRVGESVAIDRSIEANGAVILSIRHRGMVRATVNLVPGGRADASLPVAGRPLLDTPRKRAEFEMHELEGEIPVHADRDDLKAFSVAAAILGPRPTAAIMALSAIVGMHYPGLRSLFGGAEIALAPGVGDGGIRWRVSRPPRPPLPARLSFEGGGVAGALTAFVRPDAVAQPAMAVVRAAVTADEFSGQIAAVIGGSRGLGELAAKIIAAGGGKVFLSYRRGVEDARKVADEISGIGGHCEVLALDVAEPQAAVATLSSLGVPITHLYYCATPRIAKTDAEGFDATLARLYFQVYVEAFGEIVAGLAARTGAELRVFYPSSVFLDEMSDKYSEYITAKAAGEALCRWFDRHLSRVSCVVKRLPRLPTDQTAGMIRRPLADPLPVMIDSVRDMHRRSQGCR